MHLLTHIGLRGDLLATMILGNVPLGRYLANDNPDAQVQGLAQPSKNADSPMESGLDI